MHPTFKWSGMTEIDDETGTATYRMGDTEFKMRMDNFVQAQDLFSLMMKIHKNAMEEGAERVGSAVRLAIQNLT